MSLNPCPITAPETEEPVDLGDFVDSEDEALVEGEAEDSLKYLDGFYFPVCIGDLFHNGRYQIVHKLGCGGFSTVWLARDRQAGSDVALKILSSSANAAKEVQTHGILKQRVKDCSQLVLSQDQFCLNWVDLADIEREHHVMVLPLRGPSLLTLQWTKNKPIACRMSAAKQLLQAVISIHDAGMVHRDIVLGNVVYGLNVDTGKMSIPEIYKLLGRPRKGKALWDEREDGEDLVVAELVVPAKFPSEILGSDAYLCDFGISVEAGTSVPNKLQSQPGYCAPELYHDMEPSFASDMWSYMVVFIYLYAQHRAFTIGSGFAGMLNSIVEATGTLPVEWKGSYTAWDKADAQESWYGQGSQSDGIFAAFLDEHRPDISADEKTLVLSVIRQVFRPRPEDRVTASELLEDKDFNALMSIYGVE